MNEITQHTKNESKEVYNTAISTKEMKIKNIIHLQYQRIYLYSMIGHLGRSGNLSGNLYIPKHPHLCQ